jgi:hypothetical protein
VHGVPHDLDLSAFLGASVERVDLGPYIIHFRFAGAPSIGIEGDWELHDPAGSVIDQGSGGAKAPRDRVSYRVHVLLERTVTATSVAAPGSFSLTFDSGHRLVVYDRSPAYESFHIEPPGIHTGYVAVGHLTRVAAGGARGGPNACAPPRRG